MARVSYSVFLNQDPCSLKQTIYFYFRGTLVIEISRVIHPDVIGALFKTIKEYEARTVINFKMRSDEQDYIEILADAGCSSVLGKQGGRQTLSLIPGCFEIGTQMHEFMHALGVMHTFTRPDRDQYVDVFIDRVEPSMRFNYDINDYQFRKE